MTPEQKIIERNEFGVEDGIESLKVLEALSRAEGTPLGAREAAALQHTLEALESARQALSDAYDTLGATAKERRRQRQEAAAAQ